jgi:2'-5' RNA ligase
MARNRATRPDARPLRLFVAAEIPESAREAIDAAVAPFRKRLAKARWVPAENWHVTLKFLGRTWPRLSEWVPIQIGRAAGECPSFETRLEGLGAFPSRVRIRVLWVGLDDRAGRMAAICRALDAALAAEFRPETRDFTPHVTVARSDPPLILPHGDGPKGGPEDGPKDGEALDWTAPAPVSFHVERVTLFRSHLRRPSPWYEPLESFPLRP